MSLIEATKQLLVMMDEYFASVCNNPEETQVLFDKYKKFSNEVQLQFPNCACWEVDPLRWINFFDFFKDVNGSRPSGFWSVAEVKVWCDHQNRLLEIPY